FAYGPGLFSKLNRRHHRSADSGDLARSGDADDGGNPSQGAYDHLRTGGLAVDCLRQTVRGWSMFDAIVPVLATGADFCGNVVIDFLPIPDKLARFARGEGFDRRLDPARCRADLLLFGRSPLRFLDLECSLQLSR